MYIALRILETDLKEELKALCPFPRVLSHRPDLCMGAQLPGDARQPGITPPTTGQWVGGRWAGCPLTQIRLHMVGSRPRD